MIMFKKIRSKIGKRILRKRLRKISRSRTLLNFDSSHSVGVIFKAEDNSQIEIIRQFLTFLTEKKNNICAIGFVDNKKIPDFLMLKKGYNFFCRKDLNLYFLPNNPLVSDFLSKPFDILIDLSLDHHLALDYIVSMSNARFKIGPLKQNLNCYDFMIDLKSKAGVEPLIENIKHYTEVFCNSHQLKTVSL